MITIDENDLMVSKNLVSLKNFEVEEGDQMRLSEINVICIQMLLQDVMSSKSKKRRVADNNGIRNVIHQKKYYLIQFNSIPLLESEKRKM